MDKPKWWETNIGEELTIFSLAVIAITAMIIIGGESKDIVVAIGEGLVGYLARNPSP